MRDLNRQAIHSRFRRLVAAFAFVIAGAGLVTSAAAPAGATTLAAATQIVSGTNSFCALLTTGGVDCWGYNVDGQLGNGNKTNSPTPVPVLGVGGTGTLSGVAKLVQGDGGPNTFCAILTDTRLVCWGSNRAGMLGAASTADDSTSPMVVKGIGGTGDLTGVTDVAMGELTACARLSAGNVVCWGSNSNGELGGGTYSGPAVCSGSACSPTPVAAEGIGGSGTLGGVAKLVTWRGNRFCVVAGGGVACWGFSLTATPTAVPAVGGVGTLSGVDDVVIGSATCAHLTSGSVACWGTNLSGNLGNGTTTVLGTTTVPTLVVGVGGTGTLGNVTAIAGSGGSTCALLANTGVVCWGNDAGGTFWGLLGAGTNFAPADTVHCYGHCASSPVNTVGANGTGTQSGVTKLVPYGYGYGYCATLTTGGVNCWGDGPLGRPQATPLAPSVPEPVAGIGGTGTLGGVQAVAGDWPAYTGAGEVNCALLQLGRVVCWGSNTSDDLGHAGLGSTYTPVGVNGFFDTTAPTVTTSTPTSLVTLSTTVPVAWSASDNVGVDHVSVRTRVAAWNGNLGGYSTWQANTNATHANYAGTTGRTYCFSARAYDTSANASAWTADRCTAVPLRADQLSRSSAWTRNNNTGEFAGFDYRSKTKNTTLTRPGIYAKKVWLVVTKCASCGTVQIRWNGATIANVNTYNKTTVHKQVVNVANWTTTHTGTLTATVTSATGRVVAVEGLAMFNG